MLLCPRGSFVFLSPSGARMNGKDSPKAQPRAPATVRSGDRARVPFRSCRFARSPSRGRPCAVILALPVQGAELRGASNQGALDGRAAGRTGSGKAQQRAVPLQPNQGELYLHCTLSLSTSFALPCGKHFTAPLLRGVRRKIVPPPLLPSGVQGVASGPHQNQKQI